MKFLNDAIQQMQRLLGMAVFLDRVCDLFLQGYSGMGSGTPEVPELPSAQCPV
jgi:hypothetical protein